MSATIIPPSYKIQHHVPHPALRDYVAAYAYTELTADGMTSMDLFPCGITTLVVMLSDNTEIVSVDTGAAYRDRFYFVGQYSRFTPFHSTGAKAITITFRPFGAHALFGVPQYHCLDQNISATAVFPELGYLVPQLQDHCHQPSRCISLIENFLLSRIMRGTFGDKRIMYACDQIRKSGGNLPIKDLAGIVAMSPRSLEMHFREKVGLSPKLLSRILRFGDTVQYIQHSNKVDWQDVSYRFNYFDQNHFIREFKHFFGATPTQIKTDSRSIAFFVADKMKDS
ncbi:helix-turn-helix transcriptional regulator [Nostoc ellipsosporum NOK]|nr:helix-turn-helix transcriptional regulator [Nostoc ellipsosporum NOK]